MRAAVTHRDTKPLTVSEDYICAPLSRGSQQSESKQIGCNCNFYTFLMCLFNKPGIIFNVPVGIGVLQNDTENITRKFKSLFWTYSQFNSQRICSGFQYIKRLAPYFFVNQHCACPAFNHIPRTKSIHHRHCFGSSRSFIKQRSVGNFHCG